MANAGGLYYSLRILGVRFEAFVAQALEVCVEADRAEDNEDAEHARAIIGLLSEHLRDPRFAEIAEGIHDARLATSIGAHVEALAEWGEAAWCSAASTPT